MTYPDKLPQICTAFGVDPRLNRRARNQSRQTYALEKYHFIRAFKQFLQPLKELPLKFNCPPIPFTPYSCLYGLFLKIFMHYRINISDPPSSF